MTTTGAPAIQTEGLAKTYPGGIEAVVDLDLEVRTGEIFGLLGPNGAGKSTTAGMLTTRVRPSRGRARVAGVDVWADPATAKHRIGVVPQTNTLDRALSVRENLIFHGRFFGLTGRDARRAADELLATFRLADRADAPVLALSGGMAQRLMVARAVMHRPEVLFLDEPTAGLDPQSRIALWEILRRLHDEGQTILLTTHYMEEADDLCDRVAIIDMGRVIALDTPAGLKHSVCADTMVTVTAHGELEELAARLRTSVAGVAETAVVGDRLQLSVASVDGIVPAVVTTAGEAGFVVTDISVHQPTLEDVFIEMTGKELRD